MLLSEILFDIQNITKFSDAEIQNIQNDSRRCNRHSLFVAASGYCDDAHAFIPDAYARGCRYFVVEKSRLSEWQARYKDAAFIGCEDIHQALALAARRFYRDPSRAFQLVGITGTNGKTTTAFAVYQTLRRLGVEAGLIGTIEYRINDRVIPATNTTPDILRLNELMAEMHDEGVKMVVMEVSSHALALGRVTGLRFDISAFTNLTQDHLDFHKNMDAYLDAKLRLFSLQAEGEKPHPVALINRDIKQYSKIRDFIAKYPSITAKSYGFSPNTDICCEITEQKPAYTLFKLNGRPVRIAMTGQPNVYNFTLAAMILSEAGFSYSQWAPLFETITVRGRMEALHSPKGFSVIIDYAHTPDALINLLKTCRSIMEPAGRLLTVFGAGGDRDHGKRPIMGKAASELSDLVFVTSDNPRTENPEKILDDIIQGVAHAQQHKLIREADRQKAIAKALAEARPYDVVAIAGKGHEDYQIIGHKKFHFSDKECVLKSIDTRSK